MLIFIGALGAGGSIVFPIAAILWAITHKSTEICAPCEEPAKEIPPKPLTEAQKYVSGVTAGWDTKKQIKVDREKICANYIRDNGYAPHVILDIQCGRSTYINGKLIKRA